MNQDAPGGTDRWLNLKADFAPALVASTITTGVILGLVNGLLTIALMSLIFRSELSDVLPVGIGFGLVSTAVIGLIVALGSSFPGVYAGVQDASAAIIGLSTAAVSGALLASQALDTVIVMVAATSLATGFVFLALGYLGWGEIARYVPFPVIGGLLAGTGYLIVIGSLGIIGLDSVSDLTQDQSTGLAWPALALAAAFFVAARRGWVSRSYLAFLVVAVIAFHVAVAVSGAGRTGALDRGWLLGPLPEGGLWPGTIVDHLAGANWASIADQAVSLVTILVILPITLLLYLGALEIETRTDVDVNRDLRATGWANLAAAMVGGPPGYMYFSDTAVAARVLGRRRGSAVVAAVGVLALVAVGGSLLEFLPQFVIGGMLLFVGFEFIYEWLWSSRRRMMTVDYLLMWVILLVIATGGFLPGVAVGLIAATGLFIYRYSKIDVVKHQLSGVEQQSNIERPVGETEFLVDSGESTLILELQGFIFFGTANKLLDRIRSSIDGRKRLEHLVFDFRRVTGVDSSAVAVFERIALLAREREIDLVFTAMANTHSGQFEDLVSAYHDVVVVHPDLDRGLAWCEERLLKDATARSPDARPETDHLPASIAAYLVGRSYEAGEILMNQGDPSPGILLIRSGRATVFLDGAEKRGIRLRTMLPGTVLGEISLYRDEPCTASVVADERCEVLHLTPDRFDDLCRNDPVAAAELHSFVARTLAGRVSHANRVIRALHD